MTTIRQVDIVTQGGKGVGMGHIYRSVLIAKEIRKSADVVRLVPRNEETAVLLGTACDSFVIDVGMFGEYSDESDLWKETARKRCVVVDVPDPTEQWIEEIRSKPHVTSVVAMDYFGSSPPDLTISVFEHVDPLPPGRRVSGLEYALIREDVVALRGQNKERKDRDSEEVLICIGSGDVLGAGEKWALRLSRSGVSVNLVEGPLVKYANLENFPQVTIHNDPKYLPELMQRCRWAITNGGSTMMELMTLGKAVWVLPQTKMENSFSSFVFDCGGILGVGESGLENAYREWPTKEERRKVGHRAAELVDGKGAQRVSRKILGCL